MLSPSESSATDDTDIPVEDELLSTLDQLSNAPLLNSYMTTTTVRATRMSVESMKFLPSLMTKFTNFWEKLDVHSKSPKNFLVSEKKNLSSSFTFV